jgi:ketosteroid isomerase-like protein
MVVAAVLVVTVACRTSTLVEEESRSIGKEPVMDVQGDWDREGVVREVTERFTQLLGVINRKDIAAWERYYSRDGFVSAVAGGTLFATRQDWVQAITSNFSMRESQRLEVHEVRVVPLAPDTALLTSRETAETRLKNSETTVSRHVFTMIWKRGQEGWQIIHSHESWVDEPAGPGSM